MSLRSQLKLSQNKAMIWCIIRKMLEGRESPGLVECLGWEDIIYPGVKPARGPWFRLLSFNPIILQHKTMFTSSWCQYYREPEVLDSVDYISCWLSSSIVSSDPDNLLPLQVSVVVSTQSVEVPAPHLALLPPDQSRQVLADAHHLLISQLRVFRNWTIFLNWVIIYINKAWCTPPSPFRSS